MSVSPIPSQGSGTGETIGAIGCCVGLVAFSSFINQANVIAADLGVILANINSEIGTQQQTDCQNYYNTNIQPIINAFNSATPPSGDTLQQDEAELQTYNQQLGLMQSGYQSASKQLDAPTTSVQNEPSALSQSENEVITEAGTALQTLTFSAQNRIT